VQAAVKHALAQFSIAPTLEFDLDADIQRLDAVSKPLLKKTRRQQFLPVSSKHFQRKNRRTL